MASHFSHVAAAGAIGQAARVRHRGDWRFWCMAALCSAIRLLQRKPSAGIFEAK